MQYKLCFYIIRGQRSVKAIESGFITAYFQKNKKVKRILYLYLTNRIGYVIIMKSSDERRKQTKLNIAEWSNPVARRAHNPKVVGSNPASATTKPQV